MIFRKYDSKIEPTIDITALVDIIFILVIFLLISTTFKTQEYAFNITLPRLSEKKSITKTIMPVLYIDKAKKYRLFRPDMRSELSSGFSEISSVDELKVRLQQLKASNKGIALSIKADSGVEYQAVMEAVNACYQTGIERVIFPFKPAEGQN